MATVYLAHDLKHDRDVAIKVLHPDLGAALGADRCLSEIKTTADEQDLTVSPDGALALFGTNESATMRVWMREFPRPSGNGW